MRRAAALVVAFTAIVCHRGIAVAQGQAAGRTVNAAPAAARLPPPAIPGKQVPGCVVPTPAQPERVAPEDEVIYGAMEMALKGEKATREQARKAGRAIGEDVESHQLNPDPADRLTSCSRRLTDVLVANPKLRVDACLDVVDVCDPPRFGPGCCPKACLEAVRADCASHDCSFRSAAAVFNRALFGGTCVPGLERKP